MSPADMTTFGTVLRLSLIGLGYFLCALFSLSIVFQPEGIPAVWLPSGYLLAVLVLTAWRDWPALLLVIFTAHLAANQITGYPLFPGAAFALAGVLEGALAAGLLRSAAGTPLTLRRIGEVAALAGVAAAGSNALTALVGAAIAHLALGVPFWPAWMGWWLVHGVGMLVLAPVLLTWAGESLDHLRAITARQALERVILLGLTVGVAYFVFWTQPARPGLTLAYSFLVFPILLWAAARFGPQSTANLSFALALVAVWRTALAGAGPFAAGAAGIEAIVVVQVFMATASLSSLMLAAAIAERREVEVHLADLFENARDMIYTLDRQGQITSFNRAAEEVSGYSRDEVFRRRLTIDDLVAPEFRPLMRSYLQAQAAHTAPQAAEVVWVTKDGRRVPVEVSSRRLDDRRGRPAGLHAIARDISERRQAQADLELALVHTRALANAAEDANRLKSQIMANTSHELRTPLAVILGSLGLVLEGLYDTPEEARRFLRFAYEAGEHLQTVVDNLLEAARIGAGRLEINLSPVDVLTSVQVACEAIRPELERKQLALCLDLPDASPPPALADAERVRQILLNLLSNAVKFTEAGGVAVTLRPAEAGHLAIAIQDTGIGIARDRQWMLFQPFVQVDASSTRRYGGAGLGLSIAQRLAELMGGALTLYSAGEGKGTTFTLYLLVAADRPGDDAA